MDITSDCITHQSAMNKFYERDIKPIKKGYLNKIDKSRTTFEKTLHEFCLTELEDLTV